MSMILCLKPATDAEINDLLKDPETIDDFLDIEEESAYTELDKAWHGIHFILTNSDWEGDEPLCFLLSGGRSVGDIDVGYGPARALTSDQVAAFDSALEKIDETEFRKRFNPKAMSDNEIYPSIWDRTEDEDDTIGYLCSYFDDLKIFLKTTSQTRKGMIVWMT